MLLLTGALIAETAPILPLLSNVHFKTKRLACGFYQQQPVALLTTGVGPQKADKRVRQTLQKISPSAVISFGTCGALDNALQIGDLVTAEKVIDEEGNELRPHPFPSIRVVTLVTVKQVVDDAKTRATLSKRAHVCEMEAMSVGRALAHLPFGVLKVVSDQAGRDADDIFNGSLLTKPQRIARFYARASKLCHQTIKPALENILQQSDSDFYFR